MLTERTKSRLLTHSLGPGVITAPRTSAANVQRMVAVLAAADELAACADTDQMLRRAVELARESVGLERVGLYIRDPSAPRLVMRGTWGTGARGELTDEHALYYECDPAEYEQLRQIQLSGALWQYYQHVALVAEDARASAVIGHGWLAATPLVAARELVGVLYNDRIANAIRWLDERGPLPYPSVSDANARTAIDYGLYGVPETFFIGRDGRVAYKHIGPVNDSVLLAHIAELRAKPIASGAQ